MKEINIDKNHLIIFLLFALLVVLICVLIVLLYKTFCNKKNKENKIFISEGDDENENEEAINQNPAAETSRAILHTLENANLANHHGNLSSRYHSLSNQIANAFNKNESGYGNFRNSIYRSLSNNNRRMLLTEEVRTVTTFLDSRYEQIEIGAVDVAKTIEDLEVVIDGVKQKDIINNKIKKHNDHWKTQCNQIKKENDAEQNKINTQNAQEKTKIDSKNAQIIEDYKKNNPQLFQQQNNEPIAQVQQNQQQSQKQIGKKRSPKTGWEKFLNLFGLNSKEDGNVEKRHTVDFNTIPGIKKFTPKQANLKSLPEKPSDENSPFLLGNQLQGQYILHKKIYECIQNGQESKLVIRVPGHYYHVQIERENKNDPENKEINVIIADSSNNGSLVQAHISNILQNGLSFVDGEERYTDEEQTKDGENLIKFRPLTKSFNKDQIKIKVIEDNCAKQIGGYECGLFSIYNGNKEFFHAIGVNFQNKSSYEDFNRKLHSTIYLLFRASLIYGYFESNILWALKSQNAELDLDTFHKEILNETNELYVKFIKSDKSSVEKWNKALIEFDEAFSNQVRDKIKNKLGNQIENSANNEFKQNAKNVLKINFVNNKRGILPDQSIITSEDAAANLMISKSTLTQVSI